VSDGVPSTVPSGSPEFHALGLGEEGRPRAFPGTVTSHADKQRGEDKADAPSVTAPKLAAAPRALSEYGTLKAGSQARIIELSTTDWGVLVKNLHGRPSVSDPEAQHGGIRWPGKGVGGALQQTFTRADWRDLKDSIVQVSALVEVESAEAKFALGHFDVREPVPSSVPSGGRPRWPALESC
jgi:hypothetical protein